MPSIIKHTGDFGKGKFSRGMCQLFLGKALDHSMFTNFSVPIKLLKTV